MTSSEHRFLYPRPVPTTGVTDSDISFCSKEIAPNDLRPKKKPQFLKIAHKRNISLPTQNYRLANEEADFGRGRSVSLRQNNSRLRSPSIGVAPSEVLEKQGPQTPEHTAVSRTGKEKQCLVKPTTNHPSMLSPHHLTASVRKRHSPSKKNAARQSRPGDTLLLRQGPDQMANIPDALFIPSFLDHRRQLSQSREPSPPRHPSGSHQSNNMLLESRTRQLPQISNRSQWMREGAGLCTGPVEDFKAGQSGMNAVSCSLAELCNKRLPTPPKNRSSPAENKIPLSKNILSANSSDGSVYDDSNHSSQETATSVSSFVSSQWSSVLLSGRSQAFGRKLRRASQPVSPYEVMCYPKSPEAMFRRNSSPFLDTNRLPSLTNSSTTSSYDFASFPSPASGRSDREHGFERQRKKCSRRYGMVPEMLHSYKLPVDAQFAKVPPRSAFTSGRTEGPHSDTESNSIRNSSNMQQLLSELRNL